MSNAALLTIHHRMTQQQETIETWFRMQWAKTRAPFYGSVDLRHAGFKLAPVDTNLFPAGFNNLSTDARLLAAQAVAATIAGIDTNVTDLLVIAENHSRNTFYLESLANLVDILTDAGLNIQTASLDEAQTQAIHIELPSRRTLTLQPLKKHEKKICTPSMQPQYLLLNNDLSSGLPPLLQDIHQPMIPSPKLGWAERLKSIHFDYYQAVCEEFALQLECDPWLFHPLFSNCPEVNFMTNEGQSCLYHRAQELFHKIQYKYDQYGITESPFLVIKADAGTYGMAVMMIQKPEEILALNRKKRTRMSTIKGGQPVTKAIIQEGVPSAETCGHNNSVAEPVIYTVGEKVVGGFYRSHEGKGVNENLNSPGMTFSPFDDKQVHFYAYSVVARLAMLAAARESKAVSGS